MANMLDFQFEGMRLKYIKKGSSRPLLLFHANGFSAGSYAPLTDHLANHGFHVHALNFMGHGGSDSTTDFHNWEFFGRQAAAFAEHLGYERFFAVGHSIGGASLLLATPSMEGRLVAGALLDPTVFSPLTSRFASLIPNPLAALAEKRRREFKDLRVVSRSFRMNPLFKQWHPASFQGYLETAFEATNAGYRLCLDPKIEAKIFRSFHAGQWRVFRTVKKPLLIITAHKSDVTPNSAAKNLLKSHTKSRWIKHSGTHCFPMEDPEGVGREIARFFDAQE